MDTSRTKINLIVWDIFHVESETPAEGSGPTNRTVGRVTPPGASISRIKRLSANGRRGYIPNLLFGAVAQLVERHVRNVEVEGSIPFRSTSFTPQFFGAMGGEPPPVLPYHQTLPAEKGAKAVLKSLPKGR